MYYNNTMFGLDKKVCYMYAACDLCVVATAMNASYIQQSIIK